MCVGCGLSTGVCGCRVAYVPVCSLTLTHFPPTLTHLPQKQDTATGHRDNVAFSELVKGINAHASVVLTGIPEEARALAADNAGPSSNGGTPHGPAGPSSAGPTAEQDQQPEAACVRPMLPGSGLEDLAEAGAAVTTAELRVRDRRAVLGIGIQPNTTQNNPAEHPDIASLPVLLDRLDVGCLDDPPVDPDRALAALGEGTAGGALGGGALGGPSGLVAATQGLMRSNVMAAVEVLKVFWKAAGAAGGAGGQLGAGGLHMAPDKAARYRTALSKQHHTYVGVIEHTNIHVQTKHSALCHTDSRRLSRWRGCLTRIVLQWRECSTHI